MADLSARTKIALDETRTIILGAEVLFGFQFQGVFREGYERLPASSRYLEAVALILMAVTVAMLMAPPIHHRVVAGGEDSGWMHEHISMMTCAALLPFAISLGLDLHVIYGSIAGIPVGVIAGTVFAGLALFWWYGFAMIRRSTAGRKERAMAASERHEVAKTPLHAKIDQMLTEARVIIPGAQALLGFQLAVVLTDAFEKLPMSSKAVHAASLACIAIAIVLLMAPAAYHRLVYAGNDSPEFHRTGSVMITAATVPLAIGVASDVYVVMAKVFESSSTGVAIALTVFAGFVAMWHVYPALRRGQIANA